MKQVFANLFSKSKTKTVKRDSAHTSPDHLIYAIGDIHGRADLLDRLLRLIFEDIHNRTNKVKVSFVFLGDYVDRGLQSKEVIETLCKIQSTGINCIFLIGNHEEVLLDFLDDPIKHINWLQYGGTETLLSYQVPLRPGNLSKQELIEAAQTFRDHLPEKHLNFLKSLENSYSDGDYFFVHAGISPTVSLEKQKVQDLRWIRDSFVQYTKPFEKVIVHGHTIGQDVLLLPNRIALDTGAYYSGKLSCVALEGNTVRILQT
ncbi:metallophosphoesterase family protein [Terasakiella pusilla]|uniref:metallophosphoesterase family protein n=1 Tax=Terasakiella pusilla TaxID=64973 RepID=UPI003AA8E3F4